MRTMAAAKRWPVTAVRSTPHRRLVRAAAGVSAHFCVRRVTCRICPAGSSEAELSYQEPWEGGVSSAAAARGSQHDAGASGGSDGGGGVSDGGSSGSVGSLVVNLPPGAPSVHERSQAALSGIFLMVTFGNAAYFELMSNWVRTVEPLGLPYIIAAFDNETVGMCNEQGMPNTHVSFGNSTFFRDNFRAFREMGAVKVRRCASFSHVRLHPMLDLCWARFCATLQLVLGSWCR